MSAQPTQRGHFERLGTTDGPSAQPQSFAPLQSATGGPMTAQEGECRLHWPDGRETVCASCRDPL